MEGYAERRALIFRTLEDPHFKAHFRMNRYRATFEILVNTVQQHRAATGRLIRAERTPIHEVIQMGLWMMFNKDTFRSSGANFGTAPSNQHVHYKNFVEIIC
ncbi:23S rRNA (uracil(1939)-C(5))-methyltransferase [Frankliniella fusca]|uniref:23S rRNA (Uracil(1939)-C(5))-methyltransferase n=1 Tax=Frankliniella fusca TaxID=407009 RepID=A0AAE1I1X2_9NEOP|nr:23S rRNA (uracil(1939)-C(5))-methyltransferase [Frankliniella fusca]